MSVKIKFKQGCCARGNGVSYDGGKIYSVDDDKAREFVDGGYAVYASAVAKEEPVAEVAAVEESPEQATAEPQAKQRRRGRRGQ